MASISLSCVPSLTSFPFRRTVASYHELPQLLTVRNLHLVADLCHLDAGRHLDVEQNRLDSGML